jgi:glycosyltransferase involved in cell wall biosynthesis
MPDSQESGQLSADGSAPPSVTVFFPCYNEQGNVAKVAAEADAVLKGIGADYEIILVDDGSTDDTGRIADEIAVANRRVRVVHHGHNRGYGAALQSGIRAATKDLVFYSDGDGQFDLNELPPLLPLLRRYDIVIGYRLNRQDPWSRKIMGWLWTRLTCLLFSLKVRDIDCAFKLFKREVFDHITMESTGALISTEILARLSRAGYTIAERGVHHRPRTAGRQTGANPRVILRAFVELLKLRRRILKGQ